MMNRPSKDGTLELNDLGLTDVPADIVRHSSTVTKNKKLAHEYCPSVLWHLCIYRYDAM